MEFKLGDKVVALYDIYYKNSNELLFKKFEKLTVRDDDSKHWLRVQNPATGSKGYVPKHYVAPFNSPQKDWFFGNLTPRQAKKLLMKSKYPKGTFLVRNSQSKPSNYVLSIKKGSPCEGYYVRHIRIKPYGEHSFHIGSDKKKFDSLKDLMEYYIKKGEIGGRLLSKPCNKEMSYVHDTNARSSTSKQDNWEIPLEDITINKKLGQGSFGVVYAGIWRKKINIAVKAMVESSISSLQDFHNEAKIMKKLEHPHILPLFGVSKSPNDGKIFIVTELMERGSLLSVLNDRSNKLDKYDLLQFGAQVADGMAYLERKKYIHRDLATRNVLVDQEFDVKISDFGLSRTINYDVYMARTGICPRRWTAPEALQNRLFSTKSDVWSYGVLLFEIFTLGKLPYAQMHDNQDFVSLLKSGYRLPKPEHADRKVYNLMKDCWNWDANKRPAFKKIYAYMDELLEEESCCHSTDED
ncbi:tyrosine-protein kinase SRK2-like [Ctenocephalides felis]|uniref:tyrosine-protein kinase SRK2-like n=1 Tax=Ctenocephalides felis TaxID=7515 RepID=UPI000E6E4FCC|nr:tyrosine-protein kinase SRK2-like [Ctenocephalides felis]